MRGSRLVVRALEDEGARFTFGIPGTHNIELYDALEQSATVEPILVTDEQAASFMAIGVSLSSDQVGVVNVVPGAGVTHCLSGVAEAFMDNVPLVVLACGVRGDTGHAYQLHAIDQLAVLAPVTKQVRRVERAEEIYPAIRGAFQVARRGCPGPVAVEIPAELMMLTQRVDRIGFEPEPEPRSEPPRDLLERAARLITEAEHPALYVGAGARSAGADLVVLAEKLGAPVVTTIQGKGVLPESHPLWLWNGFGAQAPRFVRRVMKRCDCLVAIGCRFSEVATGSYGIDPPECLIHVDIDPAVFDRNFTASLSITCDAAAFVGALAGAIDGARPWQELAEEIAAGHRALDRRSSAAASSDHDCRVSPPALLAALQRHCGPETVFTTDSGNGTFLAMELLRLDRPGCFLGPIDFSCMGYAVPAAIGAAFAGPGRDVVALAGDGALLMTGLELLTAATHQVAPLVCVLRDGMLGQISMFQKLPLNRATCTVLPDYRVQDLAATVGCRYFRLINDSELDTMIPAMLELTRAGTPVMVEVAIDYSTRTHFTKGVLATNLGRLSWSERLRMIIRALGRRLTPGS